MPRIATVLQIIGAALFCAAIGARWAWVGVALAGLFCILFGALLEAQTRADEPEPEPGEG